MAFQTLNNIRNQNQQGQQQGTANQRQVALSFPQLLEKSKAEIARALPRHLDPDRMMRIALTVFRTNPALGKCNPMSVIAAVLQASQLGLEIGQNGEAHLVPFKDECQMIPGFTGLMKLARNSGYVKDIYAHEVRENDIFDLRLGLERILVHEPLRGRGGFPAPEQDRGDVTGFYAVAVLKDDSRTFVAMSYDEVIRIRDGSRGYQASKRFSKQSPWDTDFVPMGKKTAIRALCKLLPKSAELSTALGLDSLAENGQSQTINLAQAADGSYEPPAFDFEPVDGETGEIYPPQSPAATPKAEEPQQRQQQAPRAPQAPRPVQPAQPAQPAQSAPMSTAQQPPAGNTAKASSNASALEKAIKNMEAAQDMGVLDEIKIRSEIYCDRDVDREILERAYDENCLRLNNRNASRTDLFGQ